MDRSRMEPSEPEGIPSKPEPLPVGLGNGDTELSRRASEPQVRRGLLILCLSEAPTSDALARRLSRNRDLSKLVAEGLLERVGKTTDPTARYRKTETGRQWLADNEHDVDWA